MKSYLFVIVLTFFGGATSLGQSIMLPEHISPLHPRLVTNAATGRTDLETLITKEAWAKKTYTAIEQELSPYVIRHQTDSAWIISRLQMYWKEHYTDVFIKNGVYAYASGRAPVPTVRYTGTRDAVSSYAIPVLEDIKPYMDNDGKIYLQNKSAPGKPWEWVEQSKTGRIIESINVGIITKARDAAMIYWYTGDEKYGKFAYDILNTYLLGMYYRNEPADLNHGHDQTLVGLSAFEVIHEDVLNPLTSCYDLLYGYISKSHQDHLSLYAATFKKWADIIIKNGVPFNNWDLIEARYVANIALVLEDNKQYADGKGCQYYLGQILNKTNTRQWALLDLLKKGYDPNTGIWAECPGYSVGVLGDFTSFVSFFDRELQTDFLPQMPILSMAVLAQAQYLYPNGYIVGFGDTHYSRLPTRGMEDIIRNARLYHKTAQEETYTGMLKAVRAIYKDDNGRGDEQSAGFNALFSSPPLLLAKDIPPMELSKLLTPTFWAPNVSWMVQRSGLDAQYGLMISQAGSSGNHAHANGIAMELYGKGVVLAPEGGIGGSYFQTDYAEYYSQFPAHNTVVVDGISSYPVMKSNHPLTLNACYPRSGQASGFFPGVTFSDVSFLEPETNADQRRVMGIIRTTDTSGYYVDIFRSKRKDGKDKTHDYIYHNLGQQLELTDDANRALELRPTDKLTFANQELMGYDYWYDKKSVISANDFKAQFDLSLPGRQDVKMNMWMKGYPDREIFAVKAPPSNSYRGNVMIPDSIAGLPLPTVVVRQKGEAWNRPFAAVYEPSDGRNGSLIKAISSFTSTESATFIGLLVKSKSGINDYIMNDISSNTTRYEDMSFKGTYGTIRQIDGKLTYLFVGRGYRLEEDGYSLSGQLPFSAALSIEGDQLYYTSDGQISLQLPENNLMKKYRLKLKAGNVNRTIQGIKKIKNGQHVVQFIMPPSPLTSIMIE